MRIKKVLFYSVWILIIAVLQPTLFSAIDVFGVSPNIFLMFVVLAAFIRGKSEGAVCGAVCGLVLDLMAGRLIGVNALIYMYAGFAVGVVNERFISGELITAGVLTAIISAICSAIYYVAYSMVAGDMGFWFAVVRLILPEAIYTAVCGFILFVPIRKSFDIIRDNRLM